MGDEGEKNDLSLRENTSNIELLRVIDRTIHVSSVDRKKEVDFVVRNNSDETFNYIFLPLREFERNLQIKDEDGRLLNMYPNSRVRKWLDNLEEEDEEAYRHIQYQFKENDYKLYIQLPEEKPIKPGQLRTIRLTFEESDPVEFYSIIARPILQLKRRFFKIPSFIADVERFPGHLHDVFIVVVGTPGYEAIGSSDLEGGIPQEKLYENGLEDDTRVFSVRLPPADGQRYKGDIQYDLVPNNGSLMAGLVGY